MTREDKGLELVLKRTFRAEPERIWKAWTDPEILKKWWGPRGFTTPVSEIDFRVGGSYERGFERLDALLARLKS